MDLDLFSLGRSPVNQLYGGLGGSPVVPDWMSSALANHPQVLPADVSMALGSEFCGTRGARYCGAFVRWFLGPEFVFCLALLTPPMWT
jgi:hypothetical protein